MKKKMIWWDYKDGQGILQVTHFGVKKAFQSGGLQQDSEGVKTHILLKDGSEHIFPSIEMANDFLIENSPK